MGTGTLKRQALLLSFVCNMLITSGSQASEAPDDSLSALAAHKTETFKRLGFAAANKDYVAGKPFLTGLLAGAIAITPAYFAVTSDDFSGTNGFLVGVPGFVLPVWGGGKLVKKNSAPVPDRFMADFTPDEQRDFIAGYEEKVRQKRFHSYAKGVLVGIVAAVIYFERH